jgi:hypothetical protein
MEKYSKEFLIDCLNRADYPTNTALQESVVSQLNELGAEAQQLFDKWCADGKTPKFNVNGITSEFLIKNHKMNAIALILAYDGLIKDGEHAAWLLQKPIIRRK